MSDDPPPSECAICGDRITTDSDSKEHVIAEAIGGRLVVTGFICKRCNSETGHAWDAKLASQLLPLSLLFGVRRQRGDTPALPITTTAGEHLVIRPGGGFTLTKPSFSIQPTPEGVKIQITARSMAEAKRILAGVKGKYPNVGVEQELAAAEVSRTYPQGYVHHRLEFGGPASGRSIVKSVLALAHHAGVALSGCGDALSYLRDTSAPPCFGYYQASDLIRDRPADMPLHCVSVDANPSSGLILGYAEYFGVQRVVVCLGRNYRGERIQTCHAIDPRIGEQVELSVQLDFSEADIAEIYEYKMIPDGAYAEAFAKVMPAALERQFEDEKTRAIREATEYAFANCGAKPGEMLTDQQRTKLFRLAAERLAPFALHAWRRPRVKTSKPQD
jgi:hypothetical protein